MRTLDQIQTNTAARLQKVQRKRVRIARVRMFAQRRLSQITTKQ
jgi:hypothetical protein